MLKKDLLLIDIKVKSSRKNINNTHTQDLLYTIKNSFYILRTMKIHFISLVLIGTAYSNLHFEMQKKKDYSDCMEGRNGGISVWWLLQDAEGGCHFIALQYEFSF